MCAVGKEMEELKNTFLRRIGGRNDERDVLYAQLHLDAYRALFEHRRKCGNCQREERDAA